MSGRYRDDVSTPAERSHMASNFKVDPDKLRDSAKHLTEQVAPAYATSAGTLRTNGKIDPPGFGIALSFLEAAYTSKLDFMALDVQGAHDVSAEIATRLNQTAAEYEKGENLNIAGFDGKGSTPEGLGSAFLGALGNSVPSGAGVAVLELATILACAGSLETCAGLCPPFIPAAIAIPLFICNIPSIMGAGAALVEEARHIKDVLNSAFDLMCSSASDDWEGEGEKNFKLLTSKVKTHLDDLGDYINTVGTVLEAIGGILIALWIGLIALAVPFLIWLIAMRLAEASPPWLQDAVLEPIIEGAGVVIGTSVLTTLAGVESGVTAVAAVLSGVGSQLIGLLSPPDSGKGGVPDMQEFHVDQNYSAPL
jgi:hypothetical protein